MSSRSTGRGFRQITESAAHTATVRSGPRAGETHPCDCGRRVDHYLAMSPGLMDMHPTLFDLDGEIGIA